MQQESKMLARAMMAAVAATCVAFSCEAADRSYAWTAGDTSLGDGAVTITYDEGTTNI